MSELRGGADTLFIPLAARIYVSKRFPEYFFVNDGMKFARKVGVALLDRRAFFTDARKILGRKLGLYTRIAMKIVDNDGRAILLHLKLN